MIYLSSESDKNFLFMFIRAPVANGHFHLLAKMAFCSV